MKKIMLLVLVTVLALGLTGLLVCNGATTEIEEAAEVVVVVVENGGQPSGGGATWNNIPVYPGANQIASLVGQMGDIPPPAGDWSAVGWLL